MSADSSACLEALRLLFPGRVVTLDTLASLTREELKHAFHKLALTLHPDRAASLGATELELTRRFQQLSAAYVMLVSFVNGPRARRPAVEAQPPVERAAAAPRRAPASRGGWDGPLPNRRLRFAEFLYYSGAISWRELIDALAWQARTRPMFGRLAVERGYLPRDTVRRIILERPRGQRFGDYAVAQGYLRESERSAIVGAQSVSARPIGEYFVEARRLTPSRLASCLAQQQRHNQPYQAKAS